VRANYPDASEREIFLRCAALRLLRHSMIAAYREDPEQVFNPKFSGEAADLARLPNPPNRLESRVVMFVICGLLTR
jgi:hypothetical protein